MVPQDENPNLQQQQQDLDDAEDTLSFCDLPMYGDASDLEEFSRELDHQSSSSSFSDEANEDQQYFEFFSEEWNIPNKSDTNIVFCGKLIPYKQPLVDYNHNPQIDQHSNRGVLRLNSRSISAKSNNSNAKSMSLPVPKGRRFEEKYDFPVRKVSMMASPAKSRWYLFMFGLARLPMDNMELRDMRRRQSRKITKSGGSGGEKSGCNRGKGLWRMIRALGCNGQNRASAAVKAAYGCAPQLASE